MEKGKNNPEEVVIGRLLRYSFNDIEWNYSLLTGVEKSLVSEEEFESLKKKYGPKKST